MPGSAVSRIIVIEYTTWLAIIRIAHDGVAVVAHWFRIHEYVSSMRILDREEQEEIWEI